MSDFTNIISEDDRERCSLPSLPIYCDDGTVVNINNNRQADIALMKASMNVYIDEELNTTEYPHTCDHYYMMVRCLPNRADLNIIMAAARHMLLVDKYQIDLEQSIGIDDKYEGSYWAIRYTIGQEVIPIEYDDVFGEVGIETRQPVYINYINRRTIWNELFLAAGYSVKWGSEVLNVRKRK